MEALELYDRVYQWLFENGLDFAKSFLKFVIILLVGKIAISVICRVVQRILSQASNVSAILEKFTVDTLGKLLWLLVFLVGISSFGINVVPIITWLGVGGFILGFAFQETLGNLAAGLMFCSMPLLKWVILLKLQAQPESFKK